MDGVSVVIPCYNEERFIADCLDGLLSNGFDQDKLELLVVDGGSTDDTLNILDKYTTLHSFIKILNNEKQKTPFALNIGIKHAKFNRIMIAGAHAEYPKNYISTLYELLKRADVDAVGGAIETKTKNKNIKTESICFVLSHSAGVGNSTFRTGAKNLIEVDTVPFGLYKKNVFEDAGLYNERLIRNHDMELSSRILEKGYKIWLHPELKCTYFARETFWGLMKNNFGNGFWNLKTLKITGKFSSLSLRHYIPLLFILSIIVPPIFIPLFGKFVIGVSFLSLLAYFSLIFVISLKAKQYNLFYMIITFLSLHFSYGLGSLYGFVSMLKFWK